MILFLIIGLSTKEPFNQQIKDKMFFKKSPCFYTHFLEQNKSILDKLDHLELLFKDLQWDFRLESMSRSKFYEDNKKVEIVPIPVKRKVGRPKKI